jgi:hypothetical protein
MEESHNQEIYLLTLGSSQNAGAFTGSLKINGYLLKN